MAAAFADTLLQRLTWEDLDRSYLRRLVEIARDEDLAGLGLRSRPKVTGDRSTASLGSAARAGRADLVARQDMVACGLGLLPLILTAYGGRASVQLRARDGSTLRAGTVVATLSGDPPDPSCRRAGTAEFSAAAVRCRHANQALCRRPRTGSHAAAGHAQDDPGLPHAGKVRRRLRRGL